MSRGFSKTDAPIEGIILRSLDRKEKFYFLGGPTFYIAWPINQVMSSKGSIYKKGVEVASSKPSSFPLQYGGTHSVCFGSSYIKTEMIQRRLPWPLFKDDM